MLPRYERITFEKDHIGVQGKPLAKFVCPGHPLLDATLDLTLERHRALLTRGAVLVDPGDAGEEVRALVYLDHAIQDARTDRHGRRRVVSRRLQFVEIDGGGQARGAGYAPYLDYRPATPEERTLVGPRLEAGWLTRDLEAQAVTHAITRLVPPHLNEVRGRKLDLIARTRAAVRDRLTREIAYWDLRAGQLEAQEQAGRSPGRVNSGRARQRAADLGAVSRSGWKNSTRKDSCPRSRRSWPAGH